MKTVGALAPETLALRARYDEEPGHSDHVAALALQLFDGLSGWHKWGARPRELLFCAALLHDIGWSQTPDGKGHHKWSARLIQEYAWKNLTAAEVGLVAKIARYHRKSPPQADHVEFHALGAAAQKMVMVLGGILRIADALDRTHSAQVQRIEVTCTSESILVRVKAAGPWNAERVMFEVKSDMLQLAAQRPVICDELRDE